jgi:ribosomal protein L21E
MPLAQAQDLALPAPGVMVRLSPVFNPPILKGIKVHPDNPFRFDFIMDIGDDISLQGASFATKQSLKELSTKLVKYFLTSLTVPEKDLWVNLSPYEKDRIVPQSFGLTEMGRDLLAEDYMLKQITASLIYPEDETGKKFWKRIYEEAAKRYGTTNIPVNTFNKVWIVPEKAVVYENAKAGTAYVVESKLKVMLEQDYLSLTRHEGIRFTPQTKDTNQLGSQIVREIVIPELTKEVNENKNFAHLRQIYNSLILATWYKKKIKDSILEQVYTDRNKVDGLNIDDPKEKERIYQRYLQAFKKGVYNYIKEDIDPATQETIPRKYFSGGTNLAMNSVLQQTTSAALPDISPNQLKEVDGVFAMSGPGLGNQAMQAIENQPINSADLDNRTLEQKWAEYVIRENLEAYPELMPLYTPAIKRALLDDPALRPVFLQVLPDDWMGTMMVPYHNETLVETAIGGKTLLDYMSAYSGFLIGNAELANTLTRQGKAKIIVGVTDKYSLKTIGFHGGVANGRQCYFPLPDGTWLGIKGSGQFTSDNSPPFQIRLNTEGEFIFGYGLVREVEIPNVNTLTISLANDLGSFIQFLGYRRIHVAPDGHGNLISVGGNVDTQGDAVNFVFIYNRTLSPHRLNKIVQLLDGDPDGLARRISRTLYHLQVIPHDNISTIGALFFWILQKRGQTEAIKQNTGLAKGSFHAQDITMAGEESYDTLHFYRAQKEQVRRFENQDARDVVFLQEGINVDGLEDMLDLFNEIIGKKDVKDALLPDPMKGLEILFKEYFSYLNSGSLKHWVEQSSYIAQWLDSLDIFHHSYFETGPQSANELIFSWAKQEKDRRSPPVRDVVSGKSMAMAGALGKKSLTNIRRVGGIDLTSSKIDLGGRNTGEGLKFHFTPAMLRQLQNTPGFVPVIINVQSLGDLRAFLGLDGPIQSTNNLK